MPQQGQCQDLESTTKGNKLPAIATGWGTDARLARGSRGDLQSFGLDQLTRAMQILKIVHLSPNQRGHLDRMGHNLRLAN